MLSSKNFKQRVKVSFVVPAYNEERFIAKAVDDLLALNIAGKEKINILELPIKYYPRKFKDGKKINWRDGVKAIFCY